MEIIKKGLENRREIVIPVYKLMFQPHHECVLCWQPRLKKSVEGLLKVQRRG